MAQELQYTRFMRIQPIITRIVLFFTILSSGVILSTSAVHAYTVNGTVDAVFSSGDSGTATYFFDNVPDVPASVPRLALLALLFRKDVFVSAALLPGSLSPGLSALHPVKTTNGTIMNFLHTGLPELAFSVDFTLRDPNFNWEQRFGGLVLAGYEIDAYRGSTVLNPQAPVPEPATAMLMGISMLTLAGYGRLRLKK